MKFSQYVYEKQKKALAAYLQEHQVDLNDVDLDYLMENGFFQKIKDKTKQAAILGTAALSLGGIGCKNTVDVPSKNNTAITRTQEDDREQSRKNMVKARVEQAKQQRNMMKKWANGDPRSPEEKALADQIKKDMENMPYPQIEKNRGPSGRVSKDEDL